MSVSSEKISVIGWTLVPIFLVWSVNGVYLALLGQISITAFWAADLAQWIVLPAVALWVLAKKANLGWADYGLDGRSFGAGRSLLWSLAVFGTTWIAFVEVRGISWQLLGYPTGFFSLPDLFPSGWLGTLAWIYAAATAGFVESIFFIAVPWLWYKAVCRPRGRTAFILSISLMFGLAHWEQGPHIIISAFASHVIASIWYFRLDSLWPVAAGHMLVDMVAFY